MPQGERLEEEIKPTLPMGKWGWQVNINSRAKEIVKIITNYGRTRTLTYMIDKRPSRYSKRHLVHVLQPTYSHGVRRIAPHKPGEALPHLNASVIANLFELVRPQPNMLHASNDRFLRLQSFLE